MKQNTLEAQVLIVDSDAIFSEMTRHRLEASNFKVTTASTLNNLNERLVQQNFDFVLLDSFLGDKVSALDAIPTIAHQLPYSKIIVMSDSGTIELAVGAMSLGASSFICKTKESGALVNFLKDSVNREDLRTNQSTSIQKNNFGIIGASESLQAVFFKINQLCKSDTTVLITGESGTGKELVANAIHSESSRSTERFEVINCGAIPENLLESELFGHKRGAFTDAKSDRKGLFEVCTNGTLLLDEIGELPLSLQVKLLRALEEGEIMPLGSSQCIKINTRILTATNRNLAQEVKSGRFRADLYYRLNILEIHMPSLRERREDIPRLIQYFLHRFNERFGKNVQTPSCELISRLSTFDWPGNVRELKNAVERGVILSRDAKLHLEDMVAEQSPKEDDSGMASSIWSMPLSDAKKVFERSYLQRLIEATRGNISEVARISGRYRADIYRLISKREIERNANPVEYSTMREVLN